MPPARPVTIGNDHIFADDGPATLAFLSADDVVGYNYGDGTALSMLYR